MYHPDPEINAGISQQALEAERYDLSIGYPSRWWVCPGCNKSHNRWHFEAVGIYRCLTCGYVVAGGTMHINRPGAAPQNLHPNTKAKPTREAGSA